MRGPYLVFAFCSSCAAVGANFFFYSDAPFLGRLGLNLFVFFGLGAIALPLLLLARGGE